MMNDQHIEIRNSTSEVEAAGISDPGRMRSENQDAIYLDESGTFMLLADGMGGHERGSEASQKALEVIKSFLQPDVVASEICDITEGSGIPAEIVCLTSLIDDAIRDANSTIYSLNKAENVQRYMGTTVVGIFFAKDGNVLWFHVGDSRIYRWRDGSLKCLTTDHSAYNEWKRRGEEGEEPAKNIITRAIGPNPAVLPETLYEIRQENDIYILCSDGLTDMVSDEEIAGLLAEETDVYTISSQLVGAANDAGGKDNVSVLVCRV